MSVDIIKKSEYQTSKWTGGTTTELLIHPKNSSFGRRDFSFRLSLAQVELDESEFTHLPGINRTLMVLEGKLTLEHPGQYSVTLKKFDTDTFQGDWDTISYGRATDFNLMTMGESKGILRGCALEQDKVLKESIPASPVAVGCYAHKGSIEVQVQGNKYHLAEGDLLMVYGEGKADELQLKALDAAEIVIIKISNPRQ